MKKLPVAFALLLSALAISACTEVVTTVSVVTTEASCSVASSTPCSCEEVSSSVSSEVEEVEQEYVERVADPADVVTLPGGGLAWELDFTSDTPVESYTGVFASNVLTYTNPLVGVTKVEAKGFSVEAQLPTLASRDEDGLNIHVNRIGEWSNNAQMIFTLGTSNIPVTAGAQYDIFIELKWNVERSFRMVFAGYDTANGWADGTAGGAIIGNNQFQVLKQRSLFVAGNPGSPTTMASTTSIDMRLGWITGTKNIDVDQTLTVKRMWIMRGATNSMHTASPANVIKAFAIGGEAATFDGTYVQMKIDAIIPDNKFPAVVFTGLQLVKGSKYKLTFTHSALRKRSFEVFIGFYGDISPNLYPLKDAPEWDIMNSYTTAINTSYEFTWEGESVVDAYLVFYYGDVGEETTSTTIKVGNVTLLPVFE